MILGQTFNTHLAYPPDLWSMEFMAELGKVAGLTELWVGIDGRSKWSEENSTMSNRNWISSTGTSMLEIKWNGNQPIEDKTKQCVYLNTVTRFTLFF